jgi:serine protease Do
MKKTLLIFTFLLPSLFFSEVYGQKLSDLVAKNEKAIFQIFAYDEYGSPSSIGTGFYVNNQGKALTNVHVIEDAKFAFIRDYKGNTYQIKEINRVCEACDIAEIIVDTKGQTNSFLTTTKVIPPKASDIFVIGNPEGFESTVSTGIISSIREQENKVIQISAPISPGSSGSPIMDMTGNVIGIATYQYAEGQNLNFGYWIGCVDKLSENNSYSLSNNQTQDLFVLNEVCKGESNLIINSIELNEKNTVVNLSFTNTSLAFGDDAFIYTIIGDKSESFYIQDNNTGEKFYVYNSTIGSSPQDPTRLKLGETKRFKLYFQSIKQANSISIKEGMSGSDWSFDNIQLYDYKELSFEDKNFFNDFYLQTGLKYLSKKDFVGAYVILKEYTNTNNDNAYSHNLTGIISYIIGNNLDAFVHMNKAIEIEPTDDNLYFNLYYLNHASGNTNEALKNITTAITLNDDQPEYYAFRAEIYFANKSWKKAESDFTKIIDSDRSVTYHTYFKRAIARLWIKKNGACEDLDIAYSNCTSEEDKKVIAEWYNKYCR